MRSPEEHVQLDALTTMGVGGPASHYWRAINSEEVQRADSWARQHSVPLIVLAGGSNVIISDEGIAGLVLHLCSTGVTATRDGDDQLITAAAGERWDELVAWTVERGLAGLECLSGIPGTVGGTPIQNVGAYGQEVSSTLHALTAYDRSTKAIVSLTRADCSFGYRTSRFKAADAGRFVVCDVTFRLRAGDATLAYPDLLRYLAERDVQRPTLAQVREAVLSVRRSKGMVLDPRDVDTRSVGSFFTNPVLELDAVDRIGRETARSVPAFATDSSRMKVPAAWLLEQIGCGRGYGEGPVGLSSKHPLAIVNRGGATAKHVVAFAATLKRRVAERFGVTLFPEPAFLGFRDDDDVTYLRAGAA